MFIYLGLRTWLACKLLHTRGSRNALFHFIYFIICVEVEGTWQGKDICVEVEGIDLCVFIIYGTLIWRLLSFTEFWIAY